MTKHFRFRRGDENRIRVYLSLKIIFRARRINANHQSTDPLRKKFQTQKDQGPGPQLVPPAQGRVLKGLHHHPQEAQLRFAQGGQGAFDQRI